MRLLCSLFVAGCLIGCSVESDKSSEETKTNADGSTVTIKTKTWQRGGKNGGEKTETTLAKDGKLSVVTYEKKGDDWVKKE